MTQTLNRSWFNIFLAAASLAIVAAACTGPGQSPGSGASTGEDQRQRGGALRFGHANNFPTMNPHVKTFSDAERVRAGIYEALLRHDPATGELLPALATEWDISDDLRVYTFKLRDGVKFHNGKTMNAEDVAYSVNYARDQNNGAYGFGRVQLVAGVETPDPLTIRVTLSEPSAGFIAGLADSVKAFPVTPVDAVAPGGAEMSEAPPGTGPFKFVEWQPNQRLVLERFDNYWDQVPYVDRLVFTPIPEPEVRMSALRAGDVDVIERVAPVWAERIISGQVRNIGIQGADYAAWWAIGINVHDPILADTRVRRAMALAVNRQEIIDGAFLGRGQPTNQQFPVGHKWYVKEYPVPQPDPERARQLVQETGVGSSTIRIMTENQWEREVSILEQQLEDVGFNIEQVSYDRAATAERKFTGNYQMEWTGGGMQLDPTETYSTQVQCEPPDRRSNNFSGYCDETVEDLLEKMQGTIDDGELYGLLKEVVGRSFVDGAPYVPVAFTQRFMAFREDRVQGPLYGPTGDWFYHGGGFTHVWLAE
ncbi:MAG: hypothetical protein GEU73_04475 [Chloroflexi bacterium]|nr:hypothetical protein [Chloroflexota bacterium]